ncbi:hypothetical protein [Nonomuraea typhae]|uniref:Uncharacterized protein n=1 Tax=Nonomuraea typhae TaxID=2603600 RepID=A0ABW7YKI8_9ACTN
MNEPAGSALDINIATCREALEFTFSEQYERWRRLAGSSLRERDVHFRLTEVAWVSAISQTAYGYSMASATRAVLQQAPVPSVVAALGVADIDALLQMWQPWASRQAGLFVQGHGVVSPQDCARVGRLLAKERL